MRELGLEIASGDALAWCRSVVTQHHYLHSPPDPRSRPFAYMVRLRTDGIGCLWFGRPESTCCYSGRLTYGSGRDVESGRAAFDRWEVLNLSRVWLSPDVQFGGGRYGPEFLPGFVDRRGRFQSSLASTVVRLALSRIGFDYLMARPPCFVDEPYAIRVVLSYCDRTMHRGTLYRASGFQVARVNGRGMETWFTTAVAGLSVEQDECIRETSARDARASRLRALRE